MFIFDEDEEYRFFYKNGFEKFKVFFMDSLENKIEKIELQRNKYSVVYKIKINDINYILKEFIDNPKEKNMLYIKNKIYKSSARRLFIKTKELEDKGYNNLCPCYFVAEKKNSKKIRSFVIMEYIVGIEVDKIKGKSDLLKENLYLALRELHNQEIVSGDPNPTNFIINETKEIKLIDINAKRANFIKITKDIERFNRDFETQFGWDFWFWKYYKNYKHFIKKWSENEKDNNT
ncbi:MAG: lipopolysaccharide core heptose(II) kinase RfaY [Fusobacteriaceae bacterium]